MSTVSLQSVIDEARQAIETGAADKAVGIARHILNHYPRLIEGARLLGEACLNAGRAEEAAAAFEQVLAADPENVAAYYGLGLARQSADQPSAAIPAFERALEIQPNLAELRTQLMRLYAEAPGSAGQFRLSRAGLGRLYARGGMFGQAIDEFRAVLDTDPERDDVKVALAEALWRDGQEDEAMDFCREILARRPELLKPTLLLGYLLFASGDPRGEELWRRAAAQDPSMTMARTLFDILPPIRLEEPVLPAFDEAEWRAQEARRAAEEAHRAPAQTVGAAAAAQQASDEEDFFADSWLSSPTVTQASNQEEPAISEAATSASTDADDDEALLAALLGFDESEPVTMAPDADTPAQVQPFSFDQPEAVVATEDAPARDEIGLEEEAIVSSDIKPFSLDEWDEEELPAVSSSTADQDQSFDLADVHPFSLEDESALSDTQPFSLDAATDSEARAALQVGDEDDQLDFAALDASLGEETSLGATAADEGLGDVRPFSLDDWGADDEAGLTRLPESLGEDDSEEELEGLEPFSLDDLALESLESEPAAEGGGVGQGSTTETGEERKDFQWEEPAWRRQARLQAEASPTVEGESIFERMRQAQQQTSVPANASPATPSAMDEDMHFFSMDDEPLRPDWDAPDASSSGSESRPLTSDQRLGASDRADLSVEEDLPDLEALLNAPSVHAEAAPERDEDTAPFSLADLGLDTADATSFAPAEPMPEADLGESFSLESLGLEDDFAALEETTGSIAARSAEARDRSSSPMPDEFDLMGIDLEPEQPADALETTQEATESAPFSLADLGFTDEEIAALGLDTAEAEPAEPVEAGGDDSAAALPFSLDELGLSDEDLALLQEDVVSGATTPQETESDATATASERPTEAAPFEPPVRDSSEQVTEASDAAIAEQPGAEQPAVGAPLVSDAREELKTDISDKYAAAGTQPTAAREHEGGLGEILAQIEAEPENDTLRLAVARMSQAMQNTSQALEHYRQLIRRNGLLDDVVEDLRDMIAESDDPSLQRKMHRLLGDAFMKQNRVREAMDAYSWTPARAN